MRRQRAMTPPARASALLLVSLLGLLMIACDAAPSNTPGTSAGTSPSPVTSAAPTDVPGASSSGETGQTDTDWGRIWDALPANFPTPPGAIDADPIDRAATSGDFSVPAGPQEIVTFYTAALPAAGLTVSTQSPLEDGSVVIDASQAGTACQLQVSVKPLSGLTHVSILYGAGCPGG